MTIVKDDSYWKLHKELINVKYNALNEEDYQEVINNPDSPISIKINLEVDNEIKKILTP